jgi:hypothetical protein
VSLDYRTLTTQVADERADVREVRLKIPAGTPLPARLRGYVITDVFPLAARDIAGR